MEGKGINTHQKTDSLASFPLKTKNDELHTILATTMTRNRTAKKLIHENAFFHGNFMTTKNIPKNPVIVEIGTGEGETIEQINKHVHFLHPRTYGIDIYTPQDEKNMKTRFINKDLRDGLSIPERADRIYSRYTLQYLQNALQIVQEAYDQTKVDGIGMFHLGPIFENQYGEKILPLAKKGGDEIIKANRNCNLRIFRTPETYDDEGNVQKYAGQFLTYEKKDENTNIKLPTNIIAQIGNMYNKEYRNSEKFVNFDSKNA